MKSPLANIKPNVRAMHGYSLTACDCPIKLNQNESPFDVPDDLKDRILETVRNRAWSRYPEPMQMDLVNALARYVDVDPDGLIVCNGSNTLVQLVIGVIAEPGVDVVVPSPSFSLYDLYTRVYGGNPVLVPLTSEFAFDVPAIQKAAREPSVRLVILCSPNNPTGCAIAKSDLESLLSRTDALVMVDEAYGEFHSETALDLLPEHPNLIVLKTFSKAFGAAGIRVGYLMAHPDVRNEIIKGKIPFDINVFSHAAATAILDHTALIEERVRYICDERDRVFTALQNIDGITPYPSSANLILFEVADPSAVFNGLVEQGVLIRNVSSYPMLDHALRLSVGTREENDRFLETLKQTIDHRR